LTVVIYQEQGGDYSSDETRIKIGNVVTNRVKSPNFPNTITEVVCAKNQWGNLSKTGLVLPSRASLPQEQEALQRAVDCAKRVLEGESLLPDNVVWAAEFARVEGVYEYVDGTYFCY